MLTLRTGVPGAGKTLFAVAELARLHKQWSTEKGAASRRLVYSNVEGLTLPHWPIPEGEPLKDRFGEVISRTVDWEKVEPGSLVIFDEAQTHFPPLPVGQAVPPHIAFLNVHRHKGLDIEFITQHPKNLHANVRRLVGKHVHVRRVFGWGRAVQYEWDHCQDNLSALKTAVVVQGSYPKEAFALYKSAEVHTKQRFRLPMWLAVPVVIIPLAAWAIPSAYGTLSGAMTGKGIGNVLPAAPKPSQAAPGPAPGPSIAVPGNRPALPASAPGAGPDLGAVVPGAQEAPKLAGCVQSGSRCRCFDQQGQALDTDPAACLAKLPPAPARQLVELPPERPQASEADRQLVADYANARSPRETLPSTWWAPQ